MTIDCLDSYIFKGTFPTLSFLTLICLSEVLDVGMKKSFVSEFRSCDRRAEGSSEKNSCRRRPTDTPGFKPFTILNTC